MELPITLLIPSSKNKKIHSEKISHKIFLKRKLFLYFRKQNFLIFQGMGTLKNFLKKQQLNKTFKNFIAPKKLNKTFLLLIELFILLNSLWRNWVLEQPLLFVVCSSIQNTFLILLSQKIHF